MTSKAQATKEKLDKLNFIKLKIFVLKCTSARKKDNTPKWNTCKSHLMGKLYGEIFFFFNSWVGGLAQMVAC